MKTERSQITTIEYAGMSFEALMHPDGSYGIAVSQVAKLISATPQNLVKSLKRKLGKDIPLLRAATELNSNKAIVLTLEQTSKYMVQMAFEGNEVARAFVEASVTEKLERIVDQAFGVKVSEEQRESRFASRIDTKRTFRVLTDALKEVGFQDKDYAAFVSKFQRMLGIKDGTRDELSKEELDYLHDSQIAVAYLTRLHKDASLALLSYAAMNPPKQADDINVKLLPN